MVAQVFFFFRAFLGVHITPAEPLRRAFRVPRLVRNLYFSVETVGSGLLKVQTSNARN